MTRREVFRLIGRMGLMTAGAALPWPLLDRLGVTQEYLAEAASTWRNKTGNAGTLLCDTSTGWAKTAGTGTVSIVPDGVTWNDGVQGGLLFDQTANGGALVAARTLAAPVDLSHCRNIAIRFATDLDVTGNGSAKTKDIDLILGSGGSQANRRQFVLSEFIGPTGYIAPGLNHAVINLSQFTSTGSPDLSAINYVKVQVDAQAGTPNQVILRDIYFNVQTRPTVQIWFDDCNVTDYTNCYPVLSALNLKGTIAFTSNQLNNVDGIHLSTAQCNALYAAGWDFANHTMSHPVMTTLTQAQIIAEMTGCDAVLKANGWTRGNDCMAYPTGASNVLVDQTCAGLGIRYGRGKRVALDSFGQSTWSGVDYPMRLAHYAIENSNRTLAQANAMVDTCIGLGSTLPLYVHKVDDVGAATSWDLTAKFTPFMQRLAQLRNVGVLDVQTVTEWATELTNGRKVRQAS